MRDGILTSQPYLPQYYLLKMQLLEALFQNNLIFYQWNRPKQPKLLLQKRLMIIQIWQPLPERASVLYLKRRFLNVFPLLFYLDLSFAFCFTFFLFLFFFFCLFCFYLSNL